MQASFYAIENGNVRCKLCPHHCLIKDGETGFCRVRRNVSGTLQIETYGRLAAIHLDPIEKKPLYHFFPGSSILSIGSVGCNLRCKFCQNCDISQVGIHKSVMLEEYSVDQLVNEASSMKENIGIAFTYNEPSIFYEYMVDVAHASHLVGLKNVMVTNGYIDAEPLKNLLPFIDAYNVDLKSFNEGFYRKQTNSHLAPVKETLVLLHEHQKHFEITNLIIPGYNDSVEEFKTMIRWIVDKLGKQTVLHLSRYLPRYQFTKPETPDFVLKHFYDIAKEKLDYVYLGNVGNHMPGRHTICPQCGTEIIKRTGSQVQVTALSEDGKCFHCGEPLPITI
jgi:pyruvate formate lyase activating enzyme